MSLKQPPGTFKDCALDEHYDETAQEEAAPAPITDGGATRAALTISAAVLAICVLVSAAGLEFLAGLLSGPLGVFAILSLFLYLFAAFIVVQGAAPGEAQNKAELIKNAPLMALCLFMALESVEWFRPLFVEGAAINGLRTVLVAAFSQTPEKIGLDAALLIGVARMSLFAALAYGAGYLIYKRDDVAKRLDDQAFSRSVQTAGVFMGIFALGILFRLYGGAAGNLQAAGADLGLALYVLALMMDRHNKRPQNPAAL